MSLKKKSVLATLWSGLDIFMRQGLQFVVTIFLARLLSPEDFGTIALLYLFTGVASIFIDSGLSAALVNRQDITHKDESTVFWFSLIVSIIACVAFWNSASWIARFFNVEVLVPLVKLLSLNFVLNALGATHTALLSKELNFQMPMKIGLISSVISGAVAISLALGGAGVWALAFQMVTANLLNTVLLWFFNPWRPSLSFSFHSARRLFGFGGYLMLSGLLDVLYNRIFSLLIGKFYGVGQLGFYSRADNTKQIPVDVLSKTLARVAFPVFSAAAGDKEKLFRGVRTALIGLMFINIPMMLGLIAVAENLVVVVFGKKWLPCVEILEILSLSGVMWPLHVINLNVLKAQGHSNLFFKLEVIKKLFGFSILYVGFSYGIMGLAWGQVIFGFLAFFINAHYTGMHLNYGSKHQLADIFPIIILSLCMATVVSFLNNFVQLGNGLKLVVDIVVGVGFYFFGAWALKLRSLEIFTDILGIKIRRL